MRPHPLALVAGLVASQAALASLPDLGSCRAIADPTQRLACFDQLAAKTATTPPTAPPSGQLASTLPTNPLLARPRSPPPPEGREPSPLNTYWELTPGAVREPFTLLAYRTNYFLPVFSHNRMNRQPTSLSAANNATAAVPYLDTEAKFQLSVRTKLATDLFIPGSALWAGYTQQSMWQLWSGRISAPFRSTDYEPELIYIAPLAADLPLGWKLRYAQVGVVHQSNGQSLPLSRSWNRTYVGAGIDQGNWSLTGRVWARWRERAATDDNPQIESYIGRSELTLRHAGDSGHVASLRWRSTLSAVGRGSVQLDYAFPLWGQPRDAKLKGHLQVFSGFGQSLLDYTFRQTSVGLGFSLQDW
jgi:phospholipase A1